MTHAKTRSLFVRLLSAASALAAAAFAVPAVSAAASEGYDIFVCGVEVTEENRYDVLGDGVFTYNDWVNTLYVKGDVSASATDYYSIIKNNRSGLDICIEDCTLTHSAGYNGWQYRCVLTDGNGSKAISNAAQLTVK